uniref:RING-type domain-containing protein n=1 Tax=Biomphalaria glabrata TaxID=6526 RepID=A0A2C9L8L9_BIOGL
MNITVDIEYREIYRNVHNLFNLPFVNRERTRQDNVNASVRSISIRNLNEFQDIHSREHQIANQLSVAENIGSSNLVHQETETNAIALSDFNRTPDNLITHNSLYNVPRQSSSNSTVSNIVSTASDLLPRATTTSSDVSFNRANVVTFTPTAITSSSTTTASTNCAFDRNFVSTSISPATVRQISEEGVTQTSEEGVTQTSEEGVTQTSEEGVTQTSEEGVTQMVSETSQNSTKGNAGRPTYSELGIITERPKRLEYAVLAKRMETFTSWPRDHHLRPKELAEGGFYYAGYGDCARCFYCGGGLRNWEDEDDVWVEHARWFPKCAYIRQQMGQVFVDIVQELNKSHDHIPFTMVMEKMGDAPSAFQLDTRDTPLKRDPAVKTMVDMGFPYAEVIAVAEAIKNEGNVLSADTIYERLVSGNIKRRPNASKLKALELDKVNSETLARDAEKLKTLKEHNNQHRQQTLCKICMEKNVEVVFLPCGHLVSCTECADAMKYCPVCRNLVRGTVRVFMG